MTTTIKTHTEGCYADNCAGLVTFTNRIGICPRCGITQRVLMRIGVHKPTALKLAPAIITK